MNKDLLNQLQKNTRNIRNFCILAHVDHGKGYLLNLAGSLPGSIIFGKKTMTRYLCAL